MKKQDYEHHVRYYVPHHFIFYPLLLVLLVISVAYSINSDGHSREWQMFAIIILAVGWLSYMLRQHYALMLQNRLVRLELRLRYFELTGQRLYPLESRLTIKQLAALRFASDEELPALVQRTVNENLPPGSIKKLVKNWLPDHMRV